MGARSVRLPLAVLLLFAVAVLFVSEGAEAIDPEWSYTTGDEVLSVAISADGEYIAAGSQDAKVYLFLNNLPPTATIDSISPSPARFDAEVTFNGSGSDSDGTVVAYEWTSSRDGFLSDDEDFSTTGFSAGNHTISPVV